ncbi:hypothetical protein [Nesterenkonia sp.]|uniref:hypothetical protein n=1 Tax=Nesterenkonia sp. TaxID=704201 RepID=UPI002603A0DB|nr:hypothetical protein [Nesterenkonia sp.]
MSDHYPIEELNAGLVEVLESAAELQERIPDATRVGGTAAALYAGHRTSHDHDHVVGDLRDRYDIILEALESEPDWVTNRVTPGKVILGQIGDIEAGVRQLIRTVPLEVREVGLPSGSTVRVPTQEETLRIKAFLAVKRNQVRDYLDIAALSHRYGRGRAAQTLSEIDRYYTDPGQRGTPVADQVARQLADPRPKDSRSLQRLQNYKGLRPRWQKWENVTEVLTDVAGRMTRRDYR